MAIAHHVGPSHPAPFWQGEKYCYSAFCVIAEYLIISLANILILWWCHRSGGVFVPSLYALGCPNWRKYKIRPDMKSARDAKAFRVGVANWARYSLATCWSTTDHVAPPRKEWSQQSLLPAYRATICPGKYSHSSRKRPQDHAFYHAGTRPWIATHSTTPFFHYRCANCATSARCIGSFHASSILPDRGASCLWIRPCKNWSHLRRRATHTRFSCRPTRSQNNTIHLGILHPPVPQGGSPSIILCSSAHRHRGSIPFLMPYCKRTPPNIYPHRHR